MCTAWGGLCAGSGSVSVFYAGIRCLLHERRPVLRSAAMQAVTGWLQPRRLTRQGAALQLAVACSSRGVCCRGLLCVSLSRYLCEQGSQPLRRQASVKAGPLDSIDSPFDMTPGAYAPGVSSCYCRAFVAAMRPGLMRSMGRTVWLAQRTVMYGLGGPCAAAVAFTAATGRIVC